jgi:hypothetical protein
MSVVPRHRPPIEVVRRAPLWADPRYEGLRQRLLGPVMEPVVKIGGVFGTLDLHGMSLPGRGLSTPGKSKKPEEEVSSTQEISTPGRAAAKRAAQPEAPKTGLIHVVPMQSTDNAWPKDLRLLDLAAVVVEVEPQQFADEDSVHTEVLRLMLTGVPMIAVGRDIDLRDLQARLTKLLGSEMTVFRKDIVLFIPQPGPDPEWIWARRTLSVFTTNKKTMKVHRLFYLMMKRKSAS